jgi:hypothetical protein
VKPRLFAQPGNGADAGFRQQAEADSRVKAPTRLIATLGRKKTGNVMTNDFAVVRKIVTDAIGHLLINDQMLIKKGQERALSNRLGMYLFRYFPSWDVDCEYNRIECDDHRKQNAAGAVRMPDVIIHKRGVLGIDNNLLWIEVKIHNCHTDEDITKIKEFTSAPSVSRTIQYRYGLSLSFLPEVRIVWVNNGRKLRF